MAALTGNRAADLPERPEPTSHEGQPRRAAMAPDAKEAKLPPLRERKYIEIDRDNFNEVMKSIRPRLDFKVPEITFEHFTDKEEKDERKKEKVRPKKVEGNETFLFKQFTGSVKLLGRDPAFLPPVLTCFRKPVTLLSLYPQTRPAIFVG